MKRQPGASGRLAACLAAGLIAWAGSPAHAEVISVTVGITSSCPYGLSA